MVWTTHDRASLIDADIATFLCRFLRDVAGQERAHILEIGMVATHVHVLIRLHPTTELPRLLQRLKGGSSVSPRSLDALRQYLRNQPVHHPREVIFGWPGDVPEHDRTSPDEWIGPGRSVH